jgi:two-component system sensor histidine kinase and response regulator WspE
MKPALHELFRERLRSYLASPPSPAASRALRAAARLAGLAPFAAWPDSPTAGTRSSLSPLLDASADGFEAALAKIVPAWAAGGPEPAPAERPAPAKEAAPPVSGSKPASPAPPSAGKKDGPDGSLASLFRSEAEALFARLEQGVLAWEKAPAPEGGAELMRAAHALKGAGRIASLPDLVAQAHALEDEFSANRGSASAPLSPEKADAYLRRIDDMRAAAGLPRTPRAATASTAAHALPVDSGLLSRLTALSGENLLFARRLAARCEEAADLRRRLADFARALADAGNAGQAAAAREISQGARALENALSAHARRAQDVAGRLYDGALSLRMRPLSDLLSALPRAARDLSRSLGKRVRLVFSGETVLVDREILSALESPLNHLLRNACVHGIGTPEERRAAGKPEEGTVRISADAKADSLRLTFADDGRGLDFDAIRATAVATGRVAPQMAEALNEEDLTSLVFLPRFTTETEVRELSGRGVGLDLVMTTLRELGGEVEAHGAKGKGFSVTMSVPLSLAIQRGIVARVRGVRFVFPLSHISGVRPLGKDGGLRDGAGNALRIARADALLFEREADGAEAGNEARAILLDGGVALAVDAVEGEMELYIRPLPPGLPQRAGIAGATVLPDGEVALVLSPRELLETAQRGGTPPADGGKRRILIADDSETVRTTLSALLAAAGYAVGEARDGRHALAEAIGGKWDLVVSDVDMPRMDGISFCRALREAGERVRTVLLTYKDDAKTKREAAEAGAVAVWSKARLADPKEFLAAIAAAMPERSGASAARAE